MRQIPSNVIKPELFGIDGVEQKIVRVENGETRFPILRSLCGNQHNEAVPSLKNHATEFFKRVSCSSLVDLELNTESLQHTHETETRLRNNRSVQAWAVCMV